MSGVDDGIVSATISAMVSATTSATTTSAMMSATTSATMSATTTSATTSATISDCGELHLSASVLNGTITYMDASQLSDISKYAVVSLTYCNHDENRCMAFLQISSKGSLCIIF